MGCSRSETDCANGFASETGHDRARRRETPATPHPDLGEGLSMTLMPTSRGICVGRSKDHSCEQTRQMRLSISTDGAA
jgi:hypothetical protein